MVSRQWPTCDFTAMIDRRFPRKPKKRPRIIQKQLDLTEITADLYRVPDEIESEKVIKSFNQHNGSNRDMPEVAADNNVEIMRKVANTLIPRTLELGGKYPFIVCEDVVMPHAQM
ncbi:hypothetical protein L6452_05915 [Arctium lappa]|uniref:Uncharacterized protein n=1 Tax=Arctium lappa TaxID=4217 RepID=A0ACB9EHR8_ARCLA|nr:hypothetical protein L6452_05915 [Arctium lappa]